jgi:cyclophilin family peptidyl-prolyl cis-trans isomerase
MLATSKFPSDSDGFELYITTTAIPHLDDKLLVFGRVVRGADVVQVFG